METSKNIVRFCLALLLLGACTPKQEKTPEAQSTKELRIFVWSDYLAEDVVKEFEQANHAKVVIDYFSSNEEMLAKVQGTIQAGGKGYDLILPSDYMVGNMKKLGLLQNLDKNKLTVLADLEPRFQKPEYDPDHSVSVPYGIGTTGIVVNTKLAKGLDLKNGLSWKDLLENPKFAGKVTLLDDVKEVLATALFLQGKTVANATEDDVKRAFDYLKKIKKNIKIFTSQSREAIEKDECVLCHAYSGDVLQIMQNKTEISYVIPKEGASIWTDNWAIPKNAAEIDLAYLFINKTLSPLGAKRFVEQTFFATPSAKARELLPAELKDNKIIFPNAAENSRLHFLVERPELLQLIDRLWTELKSL